MATKKRSNAHEPVRKLGERVDTIEQKLSPMQIEDERAKVLDMLQERDELDEQWQSAKAAHKAKLADLDSRLESSRGAIRAGKVRKEIVVEEWLTRQNEVIRLDAATHLEIGRRNATREELQEELDLEAKAEDADPDDEGERELAKEVADDFGGGAGGEGEVH